MIALGLGRPFGEFLSLAGLGVELRALQIGALRVSDLMGPILVGSVLEKSAAAFGGAIA